MIDVLVVACLILALIPFCLALVNLAFYRPLPAALSANLPAVSVLIPARDEADRIAPVLEALSRNAHASAEIIIGDDGSTDRTAEIVKEFARREGRIRLIAVPAAETAGWAGKNNACYQLARAARHDVLIFLDADVIIADDGLVRLAGFVARKPEVALLSGFPEQITGSFWEKMLIPLIHFLLIGYLPFPGVRFTRHPMFGTACGQLIVIGKKAYFDVDGHAAFKSLLHDGLHLPRKLRAAGFRTDLADFTNLASTRMYDNLRDLRAGLTKNAHEAMATPLALPVWTIILLFGQVLPIVLLIALLIVGAPPGT
ncbi:MAG: glycosyltransferase, partial [Aestuariivirgaceae bacterium]